MLKFLPFILLLPLLTACSSFAYYTQAIGGHLDILSKAKPIPELIEDADLADEVKHKLRLATRARRFAVTELHLPDSGSYREYADLQRPYVVWNVVAAPQLSVEPVRSCFLVIGCLSYRGYFDRKDAERAAERLADQGYDVYVGGATAYSTLGWFDDPLLNTLMRGSGERLLGTLFHELAHQRLYVKGEPEFNEAFAVAVAQEGLKRWYEGTGQPERYAEYTGALQRRWEFYRLLGQTRDRLDDLYRSGLSKSAKLAGKAKVIAELRESYKALKSSWKGYDGFDSWMSRDINNAHLALIATYHELVPAFRMLLKQQGGDLPRLYTAARRLGGLPTAARLQHLETLLAAAELPARDNRLVLDATGGENPVN